MAWPHLLNLQQNFNVFQSSKGQTAYKLLLGLFSGTMASIINIPYDVAKSRIQGPQPIPGQIKYYHAHHAMWMIYKEEG